MCAAPYTKCDSSHLELCRQAAHGARGEQGRRVLPYSIAQGRVRKLAAKAACAQGGTGIQDVHCSRKLQDKKECPGLRVACV